jgi:hypothetical protein
MADENRTVQVNLRLPPSLKGAADKAAAQDHRSLASLIEKLLSDYLRMRPALEEWHDRALARFLASAEEKKSEKTKLGLLARSYSVNTTEAGRLEPAELVRTLRSVHSSLGNLASGADLFYVYQNNSDLIPYFTSDERIFRKSKDEILEFLSIDTRDRIGFWRVSPVGMATHISAHVEDREVNAWTQLGLRPGEWFWPLNLTRHLFQLVHHASEFSQKFPTAETVEFRCEWSGLRERMISDPDQLGYQSGKIARVDHRVTIGEWPVSELRRSWPEIVSALGGPVMRLFDNECEYSADFIRQSHLLRLP